MVRDRPVHQISLFPLPRLSRSYRDSCALSPPGALPSCGLQLPALLLNPLIVLAVGFEKIQGALLLRHFLHVVSTDFKRSIRQFNSALVKVFQFQQVLVAGDQHIRFKGIRRSQKNIIIRIG